MLATQTTRHDKSETIEDDAALVQRLLADDPAAWRTFNARFGRLIDRCITRVTSRFSSMLGPDDVREIHATFFVQLLANDKKKLRSFEPERGNKLGSWLGMLASHAAYDFLRRRRREPHIDAAVEADALVAPALDPLSACELRQRARLVASLLEEFSDKDRQFVTLYYGDGLAPERVAEHMGISVKTVYSKKHKIQRRLEALLEERQLAA